MKKLLTLLIFVLCSWFSAMAQFSGSGSGTSSDPYKIYNPDQLSQVRNFLSTSGVYFKLMNDIDLGDWISENYPSQGWQPIGSSSAPFQGVFDGNGKSITNFSINRSSTDYVGFFAYTSGATVKNLTISGTVKGKQYTGSLIGRGDQTTVNGYTFNGTLTASGQYGGGVAGYMTGTSSFSLNVNAKLSGTSFVGGLFGSASGTINTATVASEIKGTSYYVGGAIGDSQGALTVQSCTVNAPVTGTYNTGGIIGSVSDQTSVSNSKHTGNINGTDRIGGIVGSSMAKTTISNSKHTGDITGTKCIGGIIGNASYGVITLTSCYSDGNIKGTGTGYIGGIVGYMYNVGTSSISKCSSWGDICGKSYIGGVVGYNCRSFSNIDFTAKIQTYAYNSETLKNRCYLSTTDSSGYDYSNSANELHDWYTGTVGNLYINILVQSANSSNLNIEGCSAIGNLSNTGEYSGGIMGKDEYGAEYTEKKNYTYYYYKINDRLKSEQVSKKYTRSYSYTKISNSYFSGSITGTNYIGGIAGYKMGGIVSYNYANATISGSDYIGGLVGKLEKDTNDTGANAFDANVAVNTSVSATGSNAGRIYGSTDGNFAMAALGTNEENRSIATTTLYKNGVAQTLNDNLQNGTAVGISQLRYKANYVAWGWDFNSNWTIQDTETFPYKVWQTAPPTFDAIPASGATSISGKSIDGGDVTVITSNANNSYTTSATNNTWSVTFSTGLNTNEVVKAYAQKNGLEKSYISTTAAGAIGSGTPEDPYLIYTAYDLAAISKEGNYKLMNDIDLTSWINENSPTIGWPGVGVSSVSDSLVFEGDGHKITGLWSTSTSQYAGLFTYIPGANSVIKNLTVENVNINCSNNTTGYVGGLIGRFGGTIINCNVTGTTKVTQGTAIGLLAGYVEKTIRNCSATGTVEGNSNCVGILAGQASDTVEDCTANGNVSGMALYMGGLIGNAKSVKRCSSEVTVTNEDASTTQYTGGLCGRATGEVENCMASATVSGTTRVGGLCGSTSSPVKQCFSSGIVSGKKYVGGLNGYAISNVINCYSTASVTATESDAYAGGLVGYATFIVDKCYATGNVSSGYVVAGIVGYLSGSAAKANYCVAINSQVSANSESGYAMRVIGGYTNGAADPEQTSLAYKDMAVSVNNVPQRVYDDPLNGTATEMQDLKAQSTYTGMGWDFSSIWYMNESTGFPDLLWNKSKGQQSLSLTSIPTMTYGCEAYTLPATTDQGLTITWSSNQTSVATVSGNTLTVKGAGTAVITATQAGNDGYYELTKTFTLIVNKAPLTITADNKAKTVGEANPELTVSYSGFVYDDTEASLTTLPSVTTTATASSPIGTYPITASGAVAANYEITYMNGTLTVVDESAQNNVLGGQDISARSGSQVVMPIELTNEDDITALQFKLSLPEHVTVAVNAKGRNLISKTERDEYHTLSSNKQSDGSYIILLYSADVDLIEGNSGPVIDVTLDIDEDIEEGSYPASISSITLTREDGSKIYPADATININISNGLLGDADNDGTVDVADIVVVANYILTNGETAITFNNADVDGDGIIDVADIVGIANIILNGNQSNVKSRDFEFMIEPQ